MKECVGKQSFLKRILFAFALALCATVVLSGRSAQAECYSLDAYTPQEWEDPKEECNENEVISEMMRKWWQAPMKAVLDASVSVGNTTFSRVSGGALSLLTTGSLLWLALLVLKVVGSMTESDPMEWMTQVGGMMIKVGFAAALLHNRDYFFSYFFAPIIQAGAGFVDAGGVSFGKGGLSEPVGDADELDECADEHHRSREHAGEANAHLVEDNAGDDEEAENVNDVLGCCIGTEGVGTPSLLALHECLNW